MLAMSMLTIICSIGTANSLIFISQWLGSLAVNKSEERTPLLRLMGKNHELARTSFILILIVANFLALDLHLEAPFLVR